MIELSALEPLRPIRSAWDFVAYVCGCGAGLDALGSGPGRAPWPPTRRTPDGRYHRAMPRRRHG